jgi:gliding motility-associated protein GldC
MKTSDINISVSLDENKLPVKIEWKAEDSGLDGVNESKALMMAFWDKKENNTMRMDLWTKDMLVDEMKQFYHQCLLSMADTFDRATGEDKMAGDMRDFADYFAEKMKLVEKK